MTADKPEPGKVFAPSGIGTLVPEDALSQAALHVQEIIDRLSVAVELGAGDTQEDAKLETWAEQFDVKLNALTARQDAFLKYLELQAHQA